jgi:predicted RNA binding protein YcfA (HicA-like mRNA interferase family)
MQSVDVEGISRTVAVPLHGTVKKGTLKSIIRQSGLDQVLFMK